MLPCDTPGSAVQKSRTLLNLSVELAALRIRNHAVFIGGLNAVVDEGIERVLDAQILEEVLLPPSLGEAIHHLSGGQIAERCDDADLVAVDSEETGDLS